MYDFVPVCQTNSGQCLESKIKLCDLKPPQFPSWFSPDKKSMLMQTCPSWKAYQEHCKGSFDPLPWWLAGVCIVFLCVLIVAIIILYKKKRLKWASRVSDVSFQAKQMCCKNTVETSHGRKHDLNQSGSTVHSTNRSFENDEGVSEDQLGKTGVSGNTSEPYYYVLEDPKSVVLTKDCPPPFGSVDQGVISLAAPPPYRARLPPLNNNNSLSGGTQAILFCNSGKIEIYDQNNARNTEKPDKQSKRTRKRSKQSSGNSVQLSPTTNVDDKYVYGD